MFSAETWMERAMCTNKSCRVLHVDYMRTIGHTVNTIYVLSALSRAIPT